MENAYEYVKDLQREFPYQKLRFTDEFYDVTRIEK